MIHRGKTTNSSRESNLKHPIWWGDSDWSKICHKSISIYFKLIADPSYDRSWINLRSFTDQSYIIHRSILDRSQINLGPFQINPYKLGNIVNNHNLGKRALRSITDRTLVFFDTNITYHKTPFLDHTRIESFTRSIDTLFCRAFFCRKTKKNYNNICYGIMTYCAITLELGIVCSS